jgi:hypothetical protein
MAAAETTLRETLARASRDKAATPARRLGPLPFQPETFFLGRTEGAGMTRDPFGRIGRRCRITTEGAFSAAHGSIQFEETFAYDDGEVDVWRWAIRASHDGRYVAAEAKAGAGIAGERRGEDYVLSFRRPVGKATGLLAPSFTTSFTLLAPELALKQVRVSLYGVPVGSLTAFHRRVQGADSPRFSAEA